MSSPNPEEAALQQWTRNNLNFFEEPTEEEQLWVRKIFETQHFRYLISKQTLLAGRPCADPFIIAKAKVINGSVVTLEKIKPNAAKIPNICKTLNIECIDLETFMKRQCWQF
jgi:hypothetical protein